MVEELKKEEEFNRTILLILATSPTGYQSGKALSCLRYRRIGLLRYRRSRGCDGMVATKIKNE